MRGFVETPREVVDEMVDRLFRSRSPAPDDRVLDPGCGTGVFLEGIVRWCRRKQLRLPRLVGVELDPVRARTARANCAGISGVEIREHDFLEQRGELFDFIVGNPPYVPITSLSEGEKGLFRSRFETARGRFDLYLLFFERALKSLKPNGRLVFITPEKFLYVATASPLRRLLATFRIDEIALLNEQLFGGLITYPTVTSIVNCPPNGPTQITTRDGKVTRAVLDGDGASWMARIAGDTSKSTQLVLRDISVRVSCGVATGADSVFVLPSSQINPSLLPFAYPAIAGRDLTKPGALPQIQNSILVPYREDGSLLSESELGAFGDYLARPRVRERLLRRTCTSRKPWYAFHETLVLKEVLRPKILCKDITHEPRFWIDRSGYIVPRHSIYYIVPVDQSLLDPLCDYLNSDAAVKWLKSHCQRAANGFVRMQSHVLKSLPVPAQFGSTHRRHVKGRSRSSESYPELPGLIPFQHAR